MNKIIIVTFIIMSFIYGCITTQHCPPETLVYFVDNGIPSNIPKGYFDSGYFHFTAEEWAYFIVYEKRMGSNDFLTDEKYFKEQSKINENFKIFIEECLAFVEKFKEQLANEAGEAEIKRNEENKKMLERYYEEYNKNQVNPTFEEEG